MINVKHTKVDVVILHRAVIKRRGPGISPSYYERGPRLRSKEKKRKIEPKEIPSCLIPHLLVVFTRHLESSEHAHLLGYNRPFQCRTQDFE